MGALPLDISDPFAVLSASARRVVAALRGRHKGATAAVVAAEAGLDADCVNDCMHEIEDAGLAVRGARPVASFHIPESVVVWSLSDRAWTALRWMPPRLPAPRPRRRGGDESVPVELWPAFWSGQRPSEMRLPRDADAICETLLQSPIPEARLWALLHLPTRTLLESRHADDPLLRLLAATPGR